MRNFSYLISKCMEVLAFVFAPLLLALMIYATLREQKSELVMQFISCFDINLKTDIHLPHWVKDNLVNGLWAFSFANAISLASAGEKRATRFGYFGIALLVALLIELSQLYRDYGAFDTGDLLFIFFGFAIALLFRKRS